MRRALNFLWPQRIGGQIVALILMAVVITYLANMAIGAGLRGHGDFSDTSRADEGLLLTSLVLIARADDPATQDIIAYTANKSAPEINLQRAVGRRPGDAVSEREYWSPPMNYLHQALGLDFSVSIIGTRATEDRPTITLLFTLPGPSQWQATIRNSEPPLPPPFFMFGNWLILLGIFLPVVLFWVARGLSGQLQTFAKAAEDFSFEGEHAPLPETGPEEIRKAAHAFNRMRQRLAHLMEDRTRMLTAVGHDLRTPVTRMRLRAEFIEDTDIRAGVERDLERMDAMIDSALTFLRDSKKIEPTANIDLASLLDTVVTEFSDTGADVRYDGPGHATMSGNADALTRAVENLVHNGLKYGHAVTVVLNSSDPAWMIIDIEDDGPGIPAAEREAMLKPFVRGDAARSTPDGGFGLGLAIVNDAVLSHGGRMELRDGAQNGLCVRIILPVQAAPENAGWSPVVTPAG